MKNRSFVDPDQAAFAAPQETTFFFYDLETSGLRPREDRIMQFAGQRTDENLQELGEPVNLLVKMTDDTLPSPEAVMVTKITPQKTLDEGISEREFARIAAEEIFTPGTIAMGYNNVRFDDEFVRATFWRNFYEPFFWNWKDGRSRWDLLDVVRMTRALRPDGINWPVNEDGFPTNRLELMTKENGLSHEHAHDALSDVFATIAVARLLKEKQPQLFEFLFSIRGKNAVKKYVNLEQKRPFVYTSGRYEGKFNKTTVAFPLTAGRNGSVIVFDLRYNLDELLKLQPEMIKNPEKATKEALEAAGLPRNLDPVTLFPIVKTLAPNKCPAVAPLGVLEKGDGWTKIGLTKTEIEKNLKSLLSHPDFAEKTRTRGEAERKFAEPVDSESAIYAGFLNDHDQSLLPRVRAAKASDFEKYYPAFQDERMDSLLLHYKAKNFPEALSEAEQASWQDYRHERLNRQAPKFLEELSKVQEKDDFIAEELLLYFQSLQDGY